MYPDGSYLCILLCPCIMDSFPLGRNTNMSEGLMETPSVPGRRSLQAGTVGNTMTEGELRVDCLSGCPVQSYVKCFGVDIQPSIRCPEPGSKPT